MSHEHEHPHHDHDHAHCDHDHHHDHDHAHHDHDHAHCAHGHAHGAHAHGEGTAALAHEHVHVGDDYFLDQLCLIGISGAFGAVCLTMYFWKQVYLNRILAPQFHDFVLLSGIALMVLFVMRSIAVWKLAGVAGAGGEGHTHDHAHAHGHGHAHGHDHDHDHGFAPWRYVVLIVPIVLFMLDLPRPPRPKMFVQLDTRLEAGVWSTIVGSGFTPFEQVGLTAFYYSDEIEPSEVMGMEFKDLEETAYQPASRKFWEGKAVEVSGEFKLSPAGNTMFNLVRFRIQCCAGDRIQLNIGALSKEPLTHINNQDWVKVIGRIEYHQRNDGPGYVAVLRIPRAQYVQPAPKPGNPYIQ